MVLLMERAKEGVVLLRERAGEEVVLVGGAAPPSNVQESQASTSIPHATVAGKGRRGATRVAETDIGQNRAYGRTSSGRICSRFTIGGNAAARDGAAREK